MSFVFYAYAFFSPRTRLFARLRHSTRTNEVIKSRRSYVNEKHKEYTSTHASLSLVIADVTITPGGTIIY